MGITLIRTVRRTVGLVLIALVASILGLVCLQLLAPRLGYGVMTVRGASMAPAIPLGSLIMVDHPDPNALKVGDVISVQSAGGVVYTHRIAAIDATGAERRFQIRGDANATPDATMVPAMAVVGRVAFHVPLMGFVAVLMTLSTGILSILSGLASLLLAYWVLEDVEAEATGRSPGEAGSTPAPPAAAMPT